MQELFSWHPTYTGATLLLACLISNLLLSLKYQSFLHKACLMVPETKIWVLVECDELTALNLGVMVNSVSLLSASPSVVDNCPTLSTFYYYRTSPEVSLLCIVVGVGDYRYGNQRSHMPRVTWIESHDLASANCMLSPGNVNLEQVSITGVDSWRWSQSQSCAVEFLLGLLLSHPPEFPLLLIVPKVNFIISLLFCEPLVFLR